MVTVVRTCFFVGFAVLVQSVSAVAQQPPAIGYVHPPGAAAGQTVDVVLGGYDWTPDMELFVHDPRIRLEIVGPPGPVLVPEPPYWFGKKARRPPFLLPREFHARLTIPAGVPPGIVRWQVANANGASSSGHFVVGEVSHAEVREIDDRNMPQQLPALPLTVSGRIRKIEEVDSYRFRSRQSGLVTWHLTAQAIGSGLNAVVEIRDSGGRLLADVADTAGNDLALTFAVEEEQEYEICVYDLDFRGNRAFVYRLSLTPGPRVVAAIPTTAAPGTTRAVEFVGYGIASGVPKLESLVRDVHFPDDSSSFEYQLETPHGNAQPFRLFTSDLPACLEPNAESMPLSAPLLITDILDERFGAQRYNFTATKGSIWSIRADARAIGSPLDVVVTVSDEKGKELVRSDDLSDSTDAALTFAAQADGKYVISVSDLSGYSGDRSAVFQLEVTAVEPDFTLSIPELLAIPIGGTGKLTVTATRSGTFKDPITLSFEDLPAGAILPKTLEIPTGKTTASVEIGMDATAAASASLAKVVGTAQVNGRTVRHEAGTVLVAATIPPPFAIDAEGKDDVTKWPRGTTFPAPVLIERNEDFRGEITLEMTSRQGRHRQGITGPELLVPPGVERILYPVFLPEWLETTRTSRMVVNGVAKVTDPKGNVRHSLVRQKTRMGFLPVGALLKLSVEASEIVVRPGETFSVTISVARSDELTEPLRLELRSIAPGSAAFKAEPLSLDTGTTLAEFSFQVADRVEPGEYHLTIRGTVMQQSQYPAISETSLIVQVRD